MKTFFKAVVSFIKIILVVAVIVALGFLGAKKIKEVKKADATLPTAKVYPIVTKTFTPKMGEVKLTLPYLSEVANDEDVKLSSRIASRVKMIKSSGSKVRKGEVVAKLDLTSIRSGLESTQEQISAVKISLQNLQSTHQRTLELLEVQGASIEESQREISQMASAKAQLNGLKQKVIQLKNDLSYATIISPVSGTVSKTFASVGSVSTPTKPLLSISSKNGFYLMVRVPAKTDVLGIELEGKFYTAVALDTTFKGLVEYKVYVNDKKLIAGDRVEVNVVTMRQKALLLPFDTILNRDNKNYVLLADGNKSVPQEIHILKSAEQGVVVSDNLEGKKLVLAKPDILLKLTSGYALKIKE